MCEVEFGFNHMWLGLYWETWDETRKGWKDGDKWRRDYWIVIIPFIAFHITQTEK